MQSLKRIAVFLLAFIMALQVIISPSYADWEVSGGGNGSSGVLVMVLMLMICKGPRFGGFFCCSEGGLLGSRGSGWPATGEGLGAP